MKHLSEEDLILVYYAEPGAPAHARRHLDECPECQREFHSLTQALAVCDDWPVPERSAEFGRDAWMRLAPGIEEPVAAEPTVPKRALSVRLWLTATAVALLLMAVFYAGRLSRTPPPAPVMTGLSDQARQRILAIALADHLDRVQVMLTEIANTGVIDRECAEDLVQEGRLMRQSLAAGGDTATTAFLEEVETFMIEAAHTPETASPEQLRNLRERIESGFLLFKVRIVESNLRNEEQKL
jgi:hypothetical protein